MVLKPKIRKDAQEDKLRDEVISRGGHVVADRAEESQERSVAKKKEWMTFGLRIKVSMLDQIEREVEKRAGISKTGWILETIQERLNRSETKET
jgi:hypothetical protein